MLLISIIIHNLNIEMFATYILFVETLKSICILAGPRHPYWHPLRNVFIEETKSNL